MCPNRNAFTTYKPYSGDKIKVANDNFAEPVGIGKVIIEIDDGILELDEVRHVPSLGSVTATTRLTASRDQYATQIFIAGLPFLFFFPHA